MSNLIINKSSSKYAILSLGIALFLLSFLLTCLIIGDSFTQKSTGNTSAIYSLVPGHPSNAKELIVHDIEEISGLKVFSSEVISKNEAIKYFEGDLGDAALQELKANNPFQDIVSVNFNTNLSTVQVQSLRQVKAKFDNFISQVEINASANHFNWVSDALIKILLPFIAMTITFCLLIVAGSIHNDLNLNQLEIRKTVIAGVNPKLLYKNMRSTSLKNFLWALIIALVLYFITFYLISSNLNVNFSEFGYYIFVKPIFTSILLILICLLIIIHFKVTKFLKSI